MTTTRFAAALAAAVFVLAAAPGAARAAGPLDDPGFAKVITCAACHGANGNSTSDMMPIISALDPAYFKRQIESYAAGKRPSPEMEPYAKEIQFLGLDQIAAYFAAQKRVPTPIRVLAEKPYVRIVHAQIPSGLSRLYALGYRLLIRVSR